MKARRKEVDGIEYIEFLCPGCALITGWERFFHVVDTNGTHKWGWNGSLDKPTLTPSVLNWLEHRPDEDEEERKHVDSRRCHLYVRDGRIEYLSDCGHPLAGQTVDLPDIDHE